jgi:transposase
VGSKNTLTGGVTAMRRENYNKQVEKRQRIRSTTMIIGMDIGSEFNAMCLMDKGGTVVGRYPKIYNSRKGFDYFHAIIEQMKTKHGLTDVLIGMEPTGHYWRKIAFFAIEKGHEVRFVRTTALKHQREVDESSSAKSDMRDAYTIANIVGEGKYIDTIIEDGVFRQLRTLAHTRERIMRSVIGSTHCVQAVLNDYFPELRKLFWSMKSKGLMALLSIYPFPEDVLKAGLPGVTALLGHATRRKGQAREKAEKIFQAAAESVGLRVIGDADRARLMGYLEEIKQADVRRTALERQITDLVKEIPLAEYIMSLSGMGPLSCGIFLGELGNPEYFKSPKQIVKYAGYDPKENDSGSWTGRKIISKKGRWLLRKCLYFMALRVVHSSAFFKEYYEHKKKGFHRPLEKKEAICAVIIKLIRVIFALIRDRRMFTEKMDRCLEAA